MPQQLIPYLALVPLAVTLLAVLRTWLAERARLKRLAAMIADTAPANRPALLRAAAAYEAAAASVKEAAAADGPPAEAAQPGCGPCP
ncbi:hypothetical protein AB0I28_04810 [Phytomonospora sp. NPDC050363]|uniref:hypothetical protein n=1 Tax=Phytomonospora sp. NPDC050363 TaxID=3155642 RepID=UPI0033EF3CAB